MCRLHFTTHLPLSWLSSTLIPPHNKWARTGQQISPTPTCTATSLSSSLSHSPSRSHFLSLFFPSSTLFGHILAFLVAESIRLAVCWVGSGERRRKGEIERKAQKEEGGRELSNRIKGEQQNGEHLKYSWHEPSCKKEGMSNNGWITLETLCLNTICSLFSFLSIATYVSTSILLPSSPFGLIFTYWPGDVMDLTGIMLIIWARVALINNRKKVFNSNGMTRVFHQHIL